MILLTGPWARYCVIWAMATIAAAWLKHKTDYCAFLLERREPHGVPSRVATDVWCVLLFV